MQGFLLSSIVQCQRCEEKRPMMEMAQCSHRGNITYECANKCLTLAEKQMRIDKEKDKELIAQFGHLPQGAQIKAMYNIEFDDMEELGIRMRDASYHYHHNPTNEYYSWNFFQHEWRKADSSIKKLITKH